ncbi:hypothetical protein EJ02DRAFT_450136 [Clathrospora elynae]|uniref:Cryptic loci regulator 2 N-terminal domain-containing protein n=1 Tax=Clathrospora elynae TaxID=706981 RepID=A0A6A5T4H1_9PLEO|nr:hypothetical protein EJ02DRAFT_450136 [Clathrospora elynae]
MSSSRVVVRLRPGSDGDATHVPKQDNHTQVDPPVLYLEKIGQQWMERRGDALPGVKYILESLPAGYTLWQRPRSTGARHMDRYLYGHPGSKPFDSPNRFYPHFEHLMDNAGNSMGCPCTVCRGGSGVLPKNPANGSRSISSAALSRPPTVQSKGRSKMISAGLDMSCVDKEGTPDVYRNLIDKLSRHKCIDEVIQEPLSPDWRAEQEILPKLLDDLKSKEQWIPRTGDIVLFLRDLPDGVDFARHEVTGEYQLYDEKTEDFLGPPSWEAGLVAQTVQGATVADLTEQVAKTNVIHSGVRVEPIPDPNDPDKSLSKRHKYVSLRQTRPFVLWKELLHHVPQEDWHPTIKNALTLTSTLSLMGKHRFRGTWPNANIHCHGMYLCFEMLAVGDTVRLLPKSKATQPWCTDVMVIKSIRLKWSGLDKASKNDYDDGRPYNSETWVYGVAYTSDASRSDKQWLSGSNVEPPKAAADYSEWYPLHPSDKEFAIPYSRVLGRLHERHAMAFFLNSDAENVPGLDAGREGLMEARAYSRTHDQRMAREVNATWFWGDNRAEALNLETINGRDITNYDQQRDIKDLRKKIKLLDSMANDENVRSGMKFVATGAPGNKELRGFMAPAMGTLSGQVSSSPIPSVSGSSAGTGERSLGDKKRTHVVDLSDDEGVEGEIRQHTRLTGEDRFTQKKAKVSVVID